MSLGATGLLGIIFGLIAILSGFLAPAVAVAAAMTTGDDEDDQEVEPADDPDEPSATDDESSDEDEFEVAETDDDFTLHVNSTHLWFSGSLSSEGVDRLLSFAAALEENSCAKSNSAKHSDVQHREEGFENGVVSKNAYSDVC